MILKYLSCPGLRNHSYATLMEQQGYSACSLSIRLSGTGRGVTGGGGGWRGREDQERLLLLFLLLPFPQEGLILRLQCRCIGQPLFSLRKTETQPRSQVFTL